MSHLEAQKERETEACNNLCVVICFEDKLLLWIWGPKVNTHLYFALESWHFSFVIMRQCVCVKCEGEAGEECWCSDPPQMS